MGLFNKFTKSALRPTTKPRSTNDLDTTLLQLNGKHSWKLRDAVMGTQIFGATGSGKSSGSGKTLAKAFLSAGFGGIVLCAKPDERQDWENYARATGRSNDLIIFNETSSLQFNPLQYEYHRKSKGGGDILNITELIMQIYQLGKGFMSSGGSKGDERFWDNALRRCIARTISLLVSANEAITIANMRNLMGAVLIVKDIENYNILQHDLLYGNLSDPDKQFKLKQINVIIKVNYFLQCITQAKSQVKIGKVSTEKFQFIKSYFFQEFYNLGEKTKSIVTESFLGLVEPFFSGILKTHFSSGVSRNIVPEATFEKSKIIILDFSVKEFLLSGVYAQGIYKYIWQQAMERRNLSSNDQPVFLWADESQYFVNPEHDTLFQTTARSARVCTVYLTQNINNYYFKMDQARAKSLLSNLGTKIFHCNTDIETNQYASNLISSEEVKKVSQSYSQNSVQSSVSTALIPQVQPVEFAKLARGGVSKTVEAFVTGNIWNDKNFIKCNFKQD